MLGVSLCFNLEVCFVRFYNLSLLSRSVDKLKENLVIILPERHLASQPCVIVFRVVGDRASRFTFTGHIPWSSEYLDPGP